MKFTFLFLAFLIPMFSIAQNNEGEVVYTETIKLNIELPEEMAEEMKGMIPSSQTVTKSLVFNNKATLYKDWEAGENEDLELNHESEGMEFKMVMTRPENTVYSNLEDGTSVNSREFFGRMFLIDGNAKKFQWKLTGEQKKVKDYTCQKAICQVDENNIEAWFTPQIPVSSGPGEYCGLPGLILELNVNEDERTITPLKIELKELDKESIVKPKKGKKISREDFDKMEKEKMKEMEKEMGGSGGGVKMIIRN